MVKLQDALSFHDSLVKFPSRYPSRYAALKRDYDVGMRGLSCAETYWVNEDMTKLISHAAASLPDESFLKLDLPASFGLVILNEAIPLGRGPKMGLSLDYQAFSWALTDDGLGCSIVLWIGGCPASYDLILFGESWEQVHRRWKFATKTTDPPKTDRKFLYEAAAKFALEKMKSGRSVIERSEVETAVMAFPKAFWTITQQRLTEIISENPPRYVRRRLAREESALANKRVKYVKLRRVTYAYVGGTKEVDWTHRWMVDGHWRNQWLPSVEMHRQQFILPYVKGPEDKPLLLKRPLNLVVR